jgi:hypothetical protein
LWIPKEHFASYLFPGTLYSGFAVQGTCTVHKTSEAIVCFLIWCTSGESLVGVLDSIGMLLQRNSLRTSKRVSFYQQLLSERRANFRHGICDYRESTLPQYKGGINEKSSSFVPQNTPSQGVNLKTSLCFIGNLAGLWVLISRIEAISGERSSWQGGKLVLSWTNTIGEEQLF